MVMDTMVFGDFSFPYNPSFLEVNNSKIICEIALPFRENQVQNMGGASITVLGEGVFFGDNAISNFMKLEKEFLKENTEKLFLPYDKSINAVFTKLDLIGEAKKDYVKYRFEFRQANDYFSYGEMIFK